MRDKLIENNKKCFDREFLHMVLNAGWFLGFFFCGRPTDRPTDQPKNQQTNLTNQPKEGYNGSGGSYTSSNGASGPNAFSLNVNNF